MDIIRFHLDWKNYLRYRLINLLRRAGTDLVFSSLIRGNAEISIAQIVSNLDFSLASLMHSIERYGLGTPPGKMLFSPEQFERLPTGKDDSERFSELLHIHFDQTQKMVRRLKADDLLCPLDCPLLKTSLDIGWILQYASLLEQSTTTEIECLLESNDVAVKPVWASSHFMRPVPRLVFKS